MKKYYIIFSVLLVFLAASIGNAQVTFINPLLPKANVVFDVKSIGSDALKIATPYYASIPIRPNIELYWTIVVHRKAPNTTEGYIALYSGVDGPEHALNNDKTYTFAWSNVYDGYQNTIITGKFYSETIPLGHKKLYAVFVEDYRDNKPSKQLVNSPSIALIDSKPVVIPNTTPPSISNLSPASGVAGSKFTVSCSGNCTNLTAKFNNIAVGIGGSNLITVPAGATPGVYSVTVSNQYGTSNTAYFSVIPTPSLTNFLPCGNETIICTPTQCVNYGGSPAKIKGRILADENSPDYKEYVKYYSPAFAQGSEYEWVQWQYSYDNANWDDINGATGPDFQPWDCYDVTYYRRVSTHLVNRYLTGVKRVNWYTSETVTITPSSPPAKPTQSSYEACAGSSFKIYFTLGAAATSSSWSTPDGNWLINGVANAGVNGSSGYNIGSDNNVTITVPANTPAGNYQIHTSSAGACGGSGYRSIIVTVGAGPQLTVSGQENPIPGKTVAYKLIGSNATASNINWEVPYGWSISSGQGTSSILARVARGDGDGSIIATFTNPCGNATTSAAMNVTWGDYTPWITTQRKEESKPDNNGDIVSYPNPVVDGITISNVPKQAEISFYDGHGLLRKSLKLSNSVSDNSAHIDLHDLSEGIYHVRITSKGEVIKQYQIVVKR